MRSEPRWTRAQLVCRAAGTAGLLLLGRVPGRALGVDVALAGSGASHNVRRFHSRPDLEPPTLTVLRAGKTADGYLFLAPSSGPGQRGVLIVDDTGEVVWFHPTTPNTAMNFRTGRYKGQPVLTWWEGKAEKGLGRGTHVILDQSYRVVARLPAGDGLQSDLHEFLITPENTALVTSYDTRSMDLSPVGGPTRGKAIGGVVQELALPSGRVLFEWRSFDHVALEETHSVFQGHPLDYFHVNSIDLTGDGNLLVSARNTWAVYKVDRKSGEVIWRLGGKKSDFEMGRGTVFAWQHDARHHPNGRISIFDDGAAPQVEPQSRALVIALDGVRGRAELLRKYTHRPDRLVSKFMGNAQLLGNDDVLVGWGSEPYVTEFAPDGTIVFDAKLPHGGQNYRAFRLPWTGKPAIPPAIAARHRRLYASWNGATEVAAWQLLAGPRATSLVPQQTIPRQGFETVLTPPLDARYAAAIALDLHGDELAHTKPVRI